MKKLLNYIILPGLSIAMMVSCKKTVDLDPTHTINGDEFFTKVEDYDFSLTGAYQ